MCTPPPEITEFFGPLLAYSDIMEKSYLFGKFPFHWDIAKFRFVLDFKWTRDYKPLIRIGCSFITFIFPVITIVLASLTDKLQICIHFENRVPYDVILMQVFILVMLLGMFAIFVPVMFFWKIYMVGEMERSFVMFQQLIRGKFSYDGVPIVKF